MKLSRVISMVVKKISFTGHRHLKYDDVVKDLESLARTYPGAIWITGGAVGLDSHAARYALDHGIPLWLILPFPSKIMGKMWRQVDRDFLARCVKECAHLSVLSPVYNIATYQARNIRMVQLSDHLAAFYNGSRGGTHNCVSYARMHGHPMTIFGGGGIGNR